MHDTSEACGGGQVDDHMGIVVRLQESSGDAVGNGSFNGVLNDVGLLLPPCGHIDAAGAQDGGDAHGDGTRRYLLVGTEAACHLLTRGLVDEDEARGGIQSGARLIGGDIAHASDTQEHDVDTAETLYALLVEAAVALHILLLNASIGREHILRLHIDMVEEAVA